MKSDSSNNEKVHFTAHEYGNAFLIQTALVKAAYHDVAREKIKSMGLLKDMDDLIAFKVHTHDDKYYTVLYNADALANLLKIDSIESISIVTVPKA